MFSEVRKNLKMLWPSDPIDVTGEWVAGHGNRPAKRALGCVLDLSRRFACVRFALPRSPGMRKFSLFKMPVGWGRRS